MDSTILGSVLSISGVLILGGLYLFLKRKAAKRQEQISFAEGTPHISLIQHNQSSALMLVKDGGKILSINPAARRFLELKEDEAVNLERIAAKIRPKEAFFSLCAEGGEARLALEGGLFQARSILLQAGNDQVKVISLEPYSQHEEVSSKTGLPVHAWEVYQKISAEVGVHANRREAALGLLESVEFLLPADKFELGIWDANQSRLIVYQLAGLPGDPERIIQQVSSEPDPGINEFIYQRKSSVIARNLDELLQLQKDGLNLAGIDEFHSVLGIPLKMGEDTLGSLVFLSRADGAFQQEDLNVLGLIAPQMSFILYDFNQRKKEGQRSVDLTNLLTLTRGFTEIFDTRNVFDSLIKMISTLVPVEVLGFLIYDEKKQVLQGKNPFQGLPPQFIDVYLAKIPPNSETERILLQQEAIITSQASESDQWEQLGLIHLSQAASLQETALVPLVSSGRMLGYLQASNHKGGPASFSESELNMLKLAAAQAAPIIENANLLQENVRHAQHTASLRRIANLTSSAAELNDIIRLALRELSFSFNADISLMFLLEESSAALELHPSSVFGRLETPMEFSGLTMGNTQFPFSVTSSQSAQISMNCSQDDTLIPYYRDALGSYNIESIVIAPLIVRDEGIGEIWIGSHKLSQFNQTDLQFLSSAAIQIASLIENSRLLNQSDEDTRRRLDHFSTLRRIGFELNTSTDLDYMLQIIFEEAIKSTGAERGMILLFDPQKAEKLDRVPLDLVSGDTRSEPFTAAELDAARGGSPVLLQGEELGRVWLPDKRTGSAFLVPVRCEQQGNGLIALYSSRADYFDTVMQEQLQALAALAGIAVGNHHQQELLIRQKEQLSRQINTFSRLSEVTKKIQVSNSLKQNLEAVSLGITDVTPFQAVLISVFDPVNKNLVRICAQGVSDVDWRELENHANSWKDVEELLRPELKRQSTYFIPAERMFEISPDLHILTMQDESLDDPSPESWKSQDMLIIPLVSEANGPLGLISVDMPADGVRPAQEVYEALSLFGMQSVLILESHRYFNTQTENLSTLETLRNRLRWDLDQARQEVDHYQNTAGNLANERERLHHELRWANAIPGIINTINQKNSSDSYLKAFADELLDLFNFEAALITHSTPAGTKLLGIRGILSKKTNIESMLGQHNPIRHVLQEGKILSVRTVKDHTDWQNNQLLSALEADCMLAIPMRYTNASRYTLLLVASKPVEGIDSALNQLESLVRLAELGLENLQNLEAANTRLSEVTTLLDFNRKLENLESETILGNLLETVLQIIPDAEGAWVGMWDEKAKQLIPEVVRGFPAAEELLMIRFNENFNDMKVADGELSLPLRVCRIGDQLRVPEVDFPRDYRLSPSDLVHYRQASAGKLPLASLLTVLRRGDRLLGVMVIDHFSGLGEFTSQDEALAASLTHQAVLALENARLLTESENRSAQMQSLTESTAVIASTMQIEELNSLFLQQIGKILPYDNATLWLRDSQNLMIASAEGFEDQDSRVGLSVSIEDSKLFQEMERTRQPITIGNVRQDDRFPSIVPHEYLSWVGIPMMVKSELVGIIALEKREMDYFTPDQIRAGVTFASQAALSLSNARLLEESNQRTLELDQRSGRLSLLNQLSDELIASLDIDEILRVTIEQLRSALNVTRVAVVLIEGNHFVLKSELPEEESIPRRLAKAPLLEHLRQSLGVFISNNVEFENDLKPLIKSYFAPRNVKSVLMIPLETPVKLQGWIWLQTEQVYRFSSAEIDLARTMANQAAIAMQNAALFSETQRLTGDLEKEIAERTQALQEEHLHNQTLLKMINQLSISIEIDDVMEKTLDILNELLGAEQCFIHLSNGTSRMFSTGKKLVEKLPEHEPDEASPAQDIANWVLVNRAPLLVDDIRQDEKWSFEKEPAFRSVLASPLMLGEQILGTMFLLDRKSSVFNKHKIDFVEAAARQLSIALNNAQLFKLAREQSDRLVSMLRAQQIDSSRSFAILAAVADGVLVTDAENEMTLLNRSAETILGVNAAQMTGRPLLDLSESLKLADNAWFQTILHWSRDADRIPDGASFAQQLDLEDGRIVLVHLAPVVLGETFLGTVSILRDITQEVMVDRLKSDFVANVSHELRTPLTAIKGYADLMLMGASGEMSEEQNKFMRVIRENTRRLNILVNDLLDISHIDAGQLALSFRPLDLLELSKVILNDIRSRAENEGKPIEFVLEAPQTLPIINADEEKIRQVLMNLVSNAFHYTPEGGRVFVHLKQNGHEVQIDVEDNGIGISEDNRERIFERFYRGDHPFVLATAGTGLGLAISKILVEVHGGRIWFESSGVPGEGSVFSLTLPINEED